MPYENLVSELKSADVPIEQIYLDPNNPRFTGSDWQYVPETDIPLPQVQETARLKLVREFGADKLRMSMEVNGFLPIDRVVIREFIKDKYVVLEGNRRICAAKMISSITPDGEAVSERVLRSIQVIPCLVYTGSDADASWIFQGLRHISGIAEWSSYNKAKLLVEQVEESGLSLTEVGKRFGLTRHGAGQWMRGYYAFKQAKERSDYIREVDERVYPYFQELFSRSSIRVREWMGWDEAGHQFSNELNFNEFVGWFYPRPEPEPDRVESEVLGNWEARVVKRQDDIRQIAYLMTEAPDAFEQFRRDLDLEKAYAMAIARRQEEAAKKQFDPVEEVFTSIAECTRALDNVPFRMLRDISQKEKLREVLGPLESALSAIKDSL